MPMRRVTAVAGIFLPEDLSILDEIFEATGVPNETEKDREARAAFIVAKFQTGVKDRDALIEAIRSSP